MDKYAENLAKNVPDHWRDSASVAALMPQDLIAHAGGSVPDMLVWMLHNYWLHCEYAGDRCFGGSGNAGVIEQHARASARWQ